MPDPDGQLRQLLESIPEGGESWVGVDTDGLSGHLERLSQQHLTARQHQVLSRYLQGAGWEQIARELGVSRQACYLSVHGAPGKPGSGAIARLRAALAKDGELATAIAETRAEAEADDDVRVRALRWYQGLRSAQAHLYPSMATLFTLHLLADKQHRVTYADAFAHLPKQRVSECVSYLRPLGYVQTDGLTITIVRTPLEDQDADDKT